MFFRLLCVVALGVFVPLSALAVHPCELELREIIVLPSDPGFYNASRVNNPLFTSNHSLPAFVALPQSVGDIQRCLSCAARESLLVAVKAGGHSFAGYSTISAPGFVISMEKLTKVSFSSPGVVTVEAGASWIDVYSAFKASGGLWVVTGGLCPSVGVAGFSQGGGVGPTARQFGMASDNLHSVSMVLANGSAMVTASEKQHPDLFWAVRGGGGGNFGLVTELTFNVFIGPPLYTFTLLHFPGDKASFARIMLAFSRHYKAFPRDINVDATYDSSDGFLLWVVYQGPSVDLWPLLAPLLEDPSLPALLANTTQQFNCFHEMIEAYAAAKGYQKYDESPYKLKNCLVNASSFSLLAALLPVPTLPDNCDITLIHFGGAVADHARNFTAFAWRDAEYMVYSSCGWAQGNQTQAAESLAFLEGLFVQLAPACHGAYVNFMDSTQVDWPRAFYGSNLEQLVAVKQRWNPNGSSPMQFAQEIPASAWV